MKNSCITKKKNQYFYSERHQSFHYVPQGGNGDLYYREKEAFLKKNGFFDSEEVLFSAYHDPLQIKRNLANLRQILIEVTDECNLSCKYCGYGDLYGNHDDRVGKKANFKDIVSLIDYLSILWKSEFCTSFNNIIYIGFYGGEPLLNFTLIQQIVEYVEYLQLHSIRFYYSMTTNALLLDKYMNYLVKWDVKLLISLDGGKTNDSYRVTKNGKESFNIVLRNILLLKERYQDYFERSVDFNSVLHNRNSVKETIEFIKKTFGKIPTISSLSTEGVRENKKEEFMTMFQSKVDSFRKASDSLDEDEAFIVNPDILLSNFFLGAFCNQTYRNYFDLFNNSKKKTYIPTGTCKPFGRKIFLTVNGKILPCERIGQNDTLGYVKNGRVFINFEDISNQYANKYIRILDKCKKCTLYKSCGTCVFHLTESTNGDLMCKLYHPKSKIYSYFGKQLSLFEENSNYYNKIMNKLMII